MKTKGMLSMLAATAVIVITGNAGAQSGGSQKKYTDDSIVRDLKAGKLTVREAQILQDRRDHAAVKAAAATLPATPAKTGATARKTHAAKPVKPGKALKKKNKAPVRQLTSPHPRHAAQKTHGGKNNHVAKPHYAVVVKEQPAKAVSKKDRAATKKAEPIHTTAVKYIR
ncbi:hypothetical protein [Herbaspirillum lusitanum]|uniref:hypothetical protein n=1 Tax=Herbaspirillum lusitanum TaxID=213312 RepID=UPI0002F616CC|nr:hypothetical protein [Herbaspirillum lusitanum]